MPRLVDVRQDARNSNSITCNHKVLGQSFEAPDKINEYLTLIIAQIVALRRATLFEQPGNLGVERFAFVGNEKYRAFGSN